jgi:twitching motility protein PilT
MSFVPSLLQAIVRLDGEALVMHAGDKPYVVSPTGQVDLANRGLTLEAVNGVVNQLLPPALRDALQEFGAVQYELPPMPEFPGEHFTVVAARGGDDLWTEIRRRRVPRDDRVPEEIFESSPGTLGAAQAQGPAPQAVMPQPVAPSGAPQVEWQGRPLPPVAAPPMPIDSLDEAPGDQFDDDDLSLPNAAQLWRERAEPDDDDSVDENEDEGEEIEIDVDADPEETAEAAEELEPPPAWQPFDAFVPAVPLPIAPPPPAAEVLNTPAAAAPAAMVAAAPPPIAPIDVALPPPIAAAIATPPVDATQGVDVPAPVFAGAAPPVVAEQPSAPVAPTQRILRAMQRAGLTESAALRLDVSKPEAAAPAPNVTEQPPAAEAPMASAAPALEMPTVEVAAAAPPVVVEPPPAPVAEVTPPVAAAVDVRTHKVVPAAPPVVPGQPPARLAERPAVPSVNAPPPVVAAPPPAVQAPAVSVTPPPPAPVVAPPVAPPALPPFPVAPVAPSYAEAPVALAYAAAQEKPFASPHRIVPPSQPAVVLPISRHPIRGEQPPPVVSDPTLSGLERLLRVSAARGASTLYLSSGSRPSVRVDGDLQMLDGEPVYVSHDVDSLLLTLMPEHSHEALRSGAAIEWIVDIDGVGRVRCMTFRDHLGPGGVFRLMPTRSISADQLGLPQPVQALAIEPEGLVLVAGPRSSGKRTLMSAFVDLMNRTRRDHIITIEREINIEHERGQAFISQREVRGNDDDRLAAARGALREDPDVMVIEDLRTGPLMNVALEAAASGRLVVGGFSAHTATGTINRIIDLYAPEHRRQVQLALADSLRGVIVQTLLRKIGGGRLAAREVLLNTPAVSSLIAEGKTSQLPMVIEGGRRYGMMPLNDTLVGLVQNGSVEAHEAYRRSPDRPGFLAALNRHGLDTTFVERLA